MSPLQTATYEMSGARQQLQHLLAILLTNSSDDSSLVEAAVECWFLMSLLLVPHQAAHGVQPPGLLMLLMTAGF